MNSTPVMEKPRQQQDASESVLYRFDKSTTEVVGISALRFLTFASIGASIALYLAGRKQDGIFVGLWAPTFEALKASSEKENERRLAFSREGRA